LVRVAREAVPRGGARQRQPGAGQPRGAEASHRGGQEGGRLGVLHRVPEEALGRPPGRRVRRGRPRRQLRDLADAGQPAPATRRERERTTLPPMDALGPALKKGAKSFAEAGGEDAYFGDPTAASAEDGETYFEALAEVLSVSVMGH